MRRFFVLAAIAGCAPVPPPDAAPPTVVTPEAGPETAPAVSPHVARTQLSLQELREEEPNLLEYPPTACLVKQLVGDRFADLRERGGYYPVGEIDGAVAYRGALCPQPGCDGALTWIQPDGALVVALDNRETTTVFTNRRALQDAPPPAVRAFLEDSAKYAARDRIWHLRATAPCEGIEEPTRAYLAAKARRACDPRFSHFWGWAAVRGRGGEAVSFVTEPSEVASATAPGGALVALGDEHADDEGLVCAELRARGARSVGYLRRADLVPLDERPAATAPVARAPYPAWLGPAPVTHGDLTVALEAGPPATLKIALERVMAGHICEAKGTLDQQAPRLFGGGTVGCDVQALVLTNGVYLWENGDCSGARATCAGGYW